MAQIPSNTSLGLNYAHIATATTTVVKTTGGMLSKILVNTAAVGVITIYDGPTTAGPVVAILNLTTAITAPFIYLTGDIGINLKNGLTIVTSAAADLTVLYR